jgi:hypothetical protein
MWMRTKHPATGIFHLVYSSAYGAAACGRPIFDRQTEAADVAYIDPDGTFTTKASRPPLEELCVDCHAVWLKRHAADPGGRPRQHDSL